jgi:hypothetical protein
METLRSQEKFRLFNWAVVGLQHTHTHTHTQNTNTMRAGGLSACSLSNSQSSEQCLTFSRYSLQELNDCIITQIFDRINNGGLRKFTL